MPDESAPHAATWMTYGVTAEIWGDDLVEDVRRTPLLLAETIARFEPVIMLVPPGTARPAPITGVEFVEHATDDLWLRDTGPTFDHGASRLAGVDLNFNGWGDRQRHEADATVARAVCAEAGAPVLTTDLVLEGGAIEVDGQGTAILTERCVLNDNRNPGWSKEDVEHELARLLGVEKVIWLPGIAGRDITDGHTDFYARFTEPGIVVAARDDDPDSFDFEVTRTHLDLLATATDARGRSLQVHVLPAPSYPREDYLDDDFAAGYVNFYVCNGAVIAPEFGDDDADAHALGILQQLFPHRSVVQLDIDPIAAGGGGIHCATQQQPAWQAEAR